MPAAPSWTDAERRLSLVLADGGGATAREILREAVRARWGVESLHDLDRPDRQAALAKFVGTVAALEGEWSENGDVAFRLAGVRSLIAETVARFFDGAAVVGPPWRLDPSELDRPTLAAYLADADFSDPPE